MTSKAERLLGILTAAPILPVLTIEDRTTAVPLCRALVAGGLTTFEVTLTTATGLDCIKAIAGEVEDAEVGAGTVGDGAGYEAAVRAGATFVVSPGATPRLIETARDSAVPLLPGVTTAGEAMALAEHGYRLMKFFPAEAAGGVAYLKALAVALPAIGFCPAGIGAEVASAYLALANVVCVGGAWVVPEDAVAAGDWAKIGRLAREAAALGRDYVRVAD